MYFQSHGKFYVLSHFNNYPNEPFVEIEEFKDVNELDFHKGEGCIYYKIDKKEQKRIIFSLFIWPLILALYLISYSLFPTIK